MTLLCLIYGTGVSVMLHRSIQLCSISIDMLNHHFKFLSWNVRGLNNIAKQEDVKQIINLFKPGLLCLQETKLASVNQ
jgi:hypothetical protein